MPSFGFIETGTPLVEASRCNLRFAGPLSAITAVVIGLLASQAVFFAGPVLRPAGWFAQLRLRWSVPQVIGAATLVSAGWAGLAALMA